MNRLSLRKNRFEFKGAGNLPSILEEFIEYNIPILIKENRRMSTCNRLDLQTLGSQPVIMPKHLPDHSLISPTQHTNLTLVVMPCNFYLGISRFTMLLFLVTY